MSETPSSRGIAGGPVPHHRPPFVTAGYTLESAADVVAIQQLLARYCHLLDSDTSDIQRIVDLFHPQGEVRPIYENDTVHRGHEAIRAWYANYLALTRQGSRLRRHLISESRIELSGAKGWAFSMLDAQGIQVKANRLVFFAGSYEDDLVKVGDRWFFQCRRIALDYGWNTTSYDLCRNGKQVFDGEVEK